MSKERNIEILERRIVELDTKIDNFLQHNISEIKRDKLIAKKTRYEENLVILQAS